jgi:putative transposase
MIARYRDRYPVTHLCHLLSVSVSGYYAWVNRQPSPRAQANLELVAVMREIHEAVSHRYGSPRMHAELVARGYRCGVHRVARLMRQQGMVGKQRKRRPGTRFNDERGKAANLLNREFTVPNANQVWAADITYLRTAEGFVYLAVVLDLYSRRVVGWAMRPRLGADLVSSALRQALGNRRPAGAVLHHSDRDGLYACAAYHDLLTEHNFVISNSRKGNYLDNACVESFFGRLKTECLPPSRFVTREQAEREVFKYVEVFYNRVRRHSTLNYLSPVDFELNRTGLAGDRIK